MKLYTKIEGQINRFDEKGAGIFDAPGRVTKANFAYPGDIIEATTVKRDKGETQARIDKIVKPSEDRVPAKCPYAGKCGGCMWQEYNYEKQLEHKRNLINKSFSDASLPYSVEKVEPATDQFYYRNRMDYVFGPNGELGLKEPGKWFSYLDLENCFLLSVESVEILRRVRAWAKRHELKSYIPDTQKGFLRYLVIREGKFSHERMVHLVTTTQSEMPSDFVELLGELATHIIHGVNDGITDLSIATEYTVLKGSDIFTEKANGVQYQIPFGSFFQTNTAMAEKLFEAVNVACTNASEVLDLYCGVGFFALGLAKAGIKSHGVEIDPLAILAAEKTARENNLANATFNSAKSEDLSWKESKAPIVILDPPRAGLHPKVIETLRLMAPKRIVYISCKYSRFVEELPKFLNQYKISSIRAFDLFPHTPHVEIITILDLI
ncbi:MAG: 23S rRNA (uracil(1939)-C(5))-methyltransferase RlmD [bacterium]